MKHEDFRRQLHDYVDGLLPAPERHEMERHAADCRDCGREVESVRELVAAARRLPRDIEPGRDLWRVIEARIAGSSEGPATPRSRWPRFVRPRLRLAYAGAFAVVVALLFGLVVELGRHRSDAPAPVAAIDFAAVLPASLSGLELQCMGTGQLLQAALRLPAETPTREAAESLAPGLVEGLTILDRSIDETRAALVTDPGNVELQCLLAARFQQKLALLQTALMRVEAT